MARIRGYVVLCCMVTLVATGRAEPVGPEYWTEIDAFVKTVHQEMTAEVDPKARVGRLEAAWEARADYEVRRRLLDLCVSFRGEPTEQFLVAHLADETNAAVRRELVKIMGELAVDAFREPLAKACQDDPETFDFMGGCIATQGNARKEACEALEHLEEHQADHRTEAATQGTPAGWLGDGKVDRTDPGPTGPSR